MPKMVSNRRITLTSPIGLSVAFEAGVPTHVPPALISIALEKGILPENSEDLPGGEEVVNPTAPVDAKERLQMIQMAMEDIVKRNDSADFAGGMPSADALRVILAWLPSSKEVKAAWTEFRAKKAEPK